MKHDLNNLKQKLRNFRTNLYLGLYDYQIGGSMLLLLITMIMYISCKG